jgi:hypothetical protein
MTGQPRRREPKKLGPGDDPDGVGEQHQPEVAEDLRDGELDAVPDAPGGESDGHEEHGRRAEGDPLDPDPAQRGAEQQEEGEEQQRAVGEERHHRRHRIERVAHGLAPCSRIPSRQQAV